MNHEYSFLEWDTSFFGFPVARIVKPVLNSAALTELLLNLTGRAVTLVYWASLPLDRESQVAAKKNGGVLVGRRRTYRRALRDPRSDHGVAGVEEYNECRVDPDLEHLALQAGVFSRFRGDPNIPEDKYRELYRQWIARSVDHTIAQAVLVVRRAGRIVGMVTLGSKGSVGNIGLLAVDEAARRQRIGRSLVEASFRWLTDHGCDDLQVTTQEINTGACRFYEKCGFSLETTEDIYHFWLRQRA